MKIRLAVWFVAAMSSVAFLTTHAFARGGMRGGGSRGGVARSASPAISRSPSMSRVASPAVSSSRQGVARPSSGRPGGSVAGTRPAPAGLAPQGGRGNTLGAGGTGPRSGGASQAQLQQFLDLPGPSSAGRGSAGGSRSASVGRPAGANSAVADFLQSGGAPNREAGAVASQRGDLIAERTDTRSDLRDTRGENREFASDNRQQRTENRGDRQAVRVDNRGEFRSSLADGRSDRRTVRQQQLGEHADHLRDELSNHYDHDHLFDDFWSDHPHAHYRFHQNPVFWTWATVGTVQAFMPWNWGTTTYYDYGNGGNVYYEDGTVYADGTAVAADQYAEQAEAIATEVPEVEAPDQMEWLPLGVFALTQDGNADAVPNMFLQLAISREGILAGTYQNKTTGQTESIEGMVDQESQRAAWTVVDKNTPIIETGIANLTQNETRVLVHFADGRTQQWVMVHIENPDVASP